MWIEWEYSGFKGEERNLPRYGSASMRGKKREREERLEVIRLGGC